MMTGRDIIMMILANHLEDSEINLADFEHEYVKFGFLNEVDAAEKFGVSVAVIRAWCEKNAIFYTKSGKNYYIFKDAKRSNFCKN